MFQSTASVSRPQLSSQPLFPAEVESALANPETRARMQTAFVDSIMPAIRRVAYQWLHYLRGTSKFEDALQDANLHGWVRLCRSFARGEEINPWRIARHAVGRARRGLSVWGIGRHGRKGAILDPMDWRCQCRYQVKCRGSANLDRERGRPGSSRPSNPARAAAFHLDFSAWKGTRSAKECAAMEQLATGEKPIRVAERLGVSPSWISTCQRRWARSWSRFISH